MSRQQTQATLAPTPHAHSRRTHGLTHPLLLVALCLAAMALYAPPATAEQPPQAQVQAQAQAQRGRPTPQQIAWHEMEVQMFLCLDPATWQGREYDNHSTPLSEINPKQLDTDQWCEVAQSFGAKQIVFVAKHCGGFCWWQTKTTDYGIRNTPYLDGQGDVLAQLAESCKRYGLKLGVYIYPGDFTWGAGIGSGGRTKDPAKQEAYSAIYRQQWTEVLTRYGTVSELWFDGSSVIDISDLIQEHAPEAMVFQSPQATLRWPGSETGFSPEPAWQTVSAQAARSGVSTGRHSDPDGDVWLPMEMDTPLLDHAWFWSPNSDHKIKSLPHLMQIYNRSVGRGGVLLLNATPDTTGRIPDTHVDRYRELGQAINELYSNQIAQTKGTGKTIELRFDQPTPVSHIITMEDISKGHVIRAYTIDGLIDGTWHALQQGTALGYKRIDVLEDTPVLEGLRLRITDAVDTPNVPSFAAFHAPNQLTKQAADDNDAAQWTRATPWQSIVDTEWQTIDIDLSKLITQPGQYEIEIRPLVAEADPGLEIKRATVIMGQTEADRLIEQLDRPLAWHINRTAQVTTGPEGQTHLRLNLRNLPNSRSEFAFFLRRSE